MSVSIDALHIYPVKSCRGLAPTDARIAPTGLEHDRQWMLVRPDGRFVTQRELPRMALIVPRISSSVKDDALTLSAQGMRDLSVRVESNAPSCAVTVWRDTVQAIDAGDAVAAWCSDFLQTPLRLVRFGAEQRRASSRDYTGDVEALNAFTDGYPILVINRASLDDLNSRLPGIEPLPMNRFRPNVVLTGLAPYDEDRIHELRADGVRLRLVKPCTRCKITTTDQSNGEVRGVEPLTTLRSYRWDARLNGVTFGQNAIVIEGAGRTLSVGTKFEVDWR